MSRELRNGGVSIPSDEITKVFNDVYIRRLNLHRRPNSTGCVEAQPTENDRMQSYWSALFAELPENRMSSHITTATAKTTAYSVIGIHVI